MTADGPRSRLTGAGGQGTLPSMRRFHICLVALLFGTPVQAEDWHRYENGRFGYVIDVPAAFTWGAESDNGDGRAFRNGATTLAAWGGNIVEADFEAEAAVAEGFAANDGWTLTYRAVTPSWASFSGSKGQRILYERMVALCDGTRYAAFRLEYSAVDLAELDPVVHRLVESLRPSGDGAGC